MSNVLSALHVGAIRGIANAHPQHGNDSAIVDLCDSHEALRAEMARLIAERDELITRVPTDEPVGSGKFLLNAYGRRCYDAGRAARDTDRPSGEGQ